MLSRHSVGAYQGNELTHDLSGNAYFQSQFAEQLWTGPGLKSGMGMHELISTWKKKRHKKKGASEE